MISVGELGPQAPVPRGCTRRSGLDVVREGDDGARGGLEDALGDVSEREREVGTGTNAGRDRRGRGGEHARQDTDDAEGQDDAVASLEVDASVRTRGGAARRGGFPGDRGGPPLLTRGGRATRAAANATDVMRRS